MDKLQKTMRKIRIFSDEVVGEMKKSVWPEKQELMESTVVIIVLVVMLSLFVGLSDELLVTLLKLLTPSG